MADFLLISGALVFLISAIITGHYGSKIDNILEKNSLKYRRNTNDQKVPLSEDIINFFLVDFINWINIRVLVYQLKIVFGFEKELQKLIKRSLLVKARIAWFVFLTSGLVGVVSLIVY